MKLKRFVKSLINSIFFIINAILWIFKVNSLGELIVGVQVGKTKKEKFLYGMCSLLQYFSYLCIIGLVLTIMWWIKNKPSVAEKLSSLTTEKLNCTPAPASSNSNSTNQSSNISQQ